MLVTSTRWGQAGAFGAAEDAEDARSIRTPWPGQGFLDFKAGWEGGATVPMCPHGRGEQLGPSGHAAAAGTSGQADVGAQQGGRWQFCVSISFFPVSRPRISGHSGSSLAALRWEGRDTRVPSHPAVELGWLISMGGLGNPRAGGSLAKHGDLLLYLRCRAARVEGPYGPLCASLINPGMQVRRCKSR